MRRRDLETAIFHIASRAAWEDGVRHGRYVVPSLASEGFIHCSTREQLIETANRYYRGQFGLVLLCIDPNRLSSRLEYEAAAPVGGGDARDGLFPHVYGAIDLHAVFRVVDFEPNASGEFESPADMATDAS
jgi:uncharacterized protein (DUF952 family)